MAVQQTQNLPAPYIEQGIKDFLGPLGTTGATPSTTAMGLPSVAPESQFTQQARKQVAGQAGLTYDPSTGVLGAGTGISAYEPYLTQAAKYSDPGQISDFYTPQMDYVKQAMRDEQERAQNTLSSQALGAGAFGGGRHGVARGVLDAQAAQDVGLAESNMYNQAMQNMFRAGDMQSGFANQAQSLGMGTSGMLGAAGTEQLGYGQAGLDATARAAEMKRQEPFQRLGWYGGQLTGLMGGIPAPYMQQSPQGAAPSPMFQAISTGAGMYGLGSLLNRMWGGGGSRA